jgi:hypothetical protein
VTVRGFKIMVIRRSVSSFLLKRREKKKMKITCAPICLATYTLSAIAGSFTISSVQASQDVQFICASGYDPQTKQRFPTTFVLNQGHKRPLVRWKFNWFNSSEITPKKRCQDISSRFQQAYNNDSLRLITNSRSNGQKVICTAKQKGGPCNVVLLTLRQTDDAQEVLTTLKDVLHGRGGTPLMHSSGTRQVYYEIDLQKLLETIPVEEPILEEEAKIQ